MVKRKGKKKQAVTEGGEFRVFRGVGRALRLARQDRDLSQGEVASQAGITQAMLSGLETEKDTNPKLETLDKVLAALGVDLPTLASYIEGRTGAAQEGPRQRRGFSVYESLLPVMLKAALEEGHIDAEFLGDLYEQARKREEEQ